MLLLSNYSYEYNNYLEHAVRQAITPYALGCILLRYYFVWRSHPDIASSVRAWSQTLLHPDLQAHLLALTDSIRPTAPPATWRQWMVPTDTIEDHIVPTESVRITDFLECLLRAEWIDVNYVVFDRGFTFDGFESSAFALNLVRGYYISTF
jgi:hypothetical protein